MTTWGSSVANMELLLDLGLPMYEAITQGHKNHRGHTELFGEPCHDPSEDERCFQLMTPLDLIFLSRGDRDGGQWYAELLIGKYKYDVAKQCKFENGALCPSFNECLV